MESFIRILHCIITVVYDDAILNVPNEQVCAENRSDSIVVDQWLLDNQPKNKGKKTDPEKVKHFFEKLLQTEDTCSNTVPDEVQQVIA